MKALYADFPTNVSYKNGLAVSYAKLGEFNRDNLTNTTQARVYFQEAESLWKELVRDAPKVVQFQKNLGVVQKFWRICRDAMHRVSASYRPP